MRHHRRNNAATILTSTRFSFSMICASLTASGESGEGGAGAVEEGDADDAAPRSAASGPEDDFDFDPPPPPPPPPPPMSPMPTNAAEFVRMRAHEERRLAAQADAVIGMPLRFAAFNDDVLANRTTSRSAERALPLHIAAAVHSARSAYLPAYRGGVTIVTNRSALWSHSPVVWRCVPRRRDAPPLSATTTIAPTMSSNRTAPARSSSGGGTDEGVVAGAVAGVVLLLTGALWFYRRSNDSETKPSGGVDSLPEPKLEPLSVKAQPEEEATVLSVAPEAEETLPAQLPPPPATGWFAAEPEGEAMAPEHEPASFAPEASSLPPGHVSGAEAAMMMAAGEPPPQPGSWFSGAAPEPEPEFEPEPEA